MAAFGIEMASGKAYCRGTYPGCICDWKSSHRGKIPKDTKCLWISVSGAGGGATAFYCEKCMVTVLQKMRDLLDSA